VVEKIFFNKHSDKKNHEPAYQRYARQAKRIPTKYSSQTHAMMRQTYLYHFILCTHRETIAHSRQRAGQGLRLKKP
jgi:hypothetical protein